MSQPSEDSRAAAPLRSFEDLEELLRADRVQFRSDPAHGRVEIPTAVGGEGTVLMLIWDGRQPFLHLTLALPFEVPAARTARVEHAILTLNHGMALPGFGINHATRTVYYRISLPRRLDGSVAAGELRGLINVAATTARQHGAALRDLAAGDEAVAGPSAGRP